MANATVTAPRQSDRLPVPEQVVADLTDGDRFARLLPACYRDSAERWINRGKLYLLTCKQSAKLLSCSRKSLVMAFLQGAEQGLPVDGKLAYLVPYGTDATFMASYVGLVAVARRHGLVTDAYARLVRERDEFDLQMDDGQFKVHFRPHIGADAGEVIGAFACLLFPNKRVIADFMSAEEIESIRKRSKAASSGPWVTDWGEMAKKTVIRRTIKTYVDDPEVLSLLDSEDRDHGIIDVDGVEVPDGKRVGARRAAPLARLPEPTAAMPEPHEPPLEARSEPEPERELTVPQQLDALYEGFDNRKVILDRFEALQNAPDTPGTELEQQAAKDRALGRCK